jgi:hypothetical protein
VDRSFRMHMKCVDNSSNNNNNNKYLKPFIDAVICVFQPFILDLNGEETPAYGKPEITRRKETSHEKSSRTEVSITIEQKLNLFSLRMSSFT